MIIYWSMLGMTGILAFIQWKMGEKKNSYR